MVQRIYTYGDASSTPLRTNPWNAKEFQCRSLCQLLAYIDLSLTRSDMRLELPFRYGHAWKALIWMFSSGLRRCCDAVDRSLCAIYTYIFCWCFAEHRNKNASQVVMMHFRSLPHSLEVFEECWWGMTMLYLIWLYQHFSLYSMCGCGFWCMFALRMPEIVMNRVEVRRLLSFNEWQLQK